MANMDSVNPPFETDSYAVELQAIEDYRRFAILTIQRFWRGHAVRQRLRRERYAAAKAAAEAAAAASAAARLYHAARTIQDTWRSRRNRRIFQYYRQLLGFRAKGDPRAMLRAINPREAALLDAAAGAHVRFRLGGSSFPPVVLYKIFTHRPVVDINAFAPRDYAFEPPEPSPELNLYPSAASAAAAASGQQRRGAAQAGASGEGAGDSAAEGQEELRPYVRPDGSIGYRSTKGWYRRRDNNGWRPVAWQLLLEPSQQAALAALLGATAAQRRRQKRARVQLAEGACSDGSGGSGGWSGGCGAGRGHEPVTHYSHIVRRGERELRMKQRRRDWLLKLYRQGLLEPSEADGTQPGSSEAHGAEGGSGTGAGGGGEAADRGHSGSGKGVWEEAVAGVGASSADEEALLADLERRLQRHLLRQRLHQPASRRTAQQVGGGEFCVDQSMADAGEGLEEQEGEEEGEEEEEEEEEEEGDLLKWCQALDFAAYSANWVASACTLGSEAAANAVLGEEALFAQLIEAQEQQQQGEEGAGASYAVRMAAAVPVAAG